MLGKEEEEEAVAALVLPPWEEDEEGMCYVVLYMMIGYYCAGKMSAMRQQTSQTPQLVQHDAPLGIHGWASSAEVTGLIY